MDISENEFRDQLFNSHKQNLCDLFIGRRDPVEWLGEGFPPISVLLQQMAERRINQALDELSDLVLIAKELRLERANDSTTRIDLFGCSGGTGLTIIELKKSKQTERQAFTELLGYANHFCQIFPGLTEDSITSILVSPMQTRIVRDAYTQELIANNKNIVALIPSGKNGVIQLKVFYPDEAYYKWFENNLLDDRSMMAVAISFPEIKGWIDTDFEQENNAVPEYSQKALNTITSAIALKLEANGFHSLVYASQKWGEIANNWPYPNHIYAVAINPFASFRTSVYEDRVLGESSDGRLEDLQRIHSQVLIEEQDSWLDLIETHFSNRFSALVLDEFDLCFKNKKQEVMSKEIGYPDWGAIKRSVLDSVYVHHFNIYSTGLLREIYGHYVDYIYQPHIKFCAHYSDDFPKYSYDMLRDFLAVWEIIKILGFSNSEGDE